MGRTTPSRKLPFPPMEAELVAELPVGDWQYEPKWDGFRGILENVGGELALWSRNGRPLLRYFPELRLLGERLPPCSAVDGEIVIERDGALDFDALQTRLHPAESRIRKLSGEIPAAYVCFDVLLWEGEELHRAPLEERRARVETLPLDASPATRDVELARTWLERFEAAGLDGVVAKRLALPYLPGSRDGVVKVKPHKSADCVVVGLRWKKDERKIATLLLGLYTGTASFATSARPPSQQGVRLRWPSWCSRFWRTLRIGGSRSRTAGAPATSRRPPSGPSSSSRRDTTSGRATASATACASCAGDPTRTRRSAPSTRCACARSRATRRCRASLVLIAPSSGRAR